MFLYWKQLKAALILFGPLAGGRFAKFLCNKDMTGWYRQLKLPSFMFKPKTMRFIWISMYTLMGVASYRVYLKLPSQPLLQPTNYIDQLTAPQNALYLFYSQLLLGWGWGVLFFKFKKIRLAQITQLGVWSIAALTTRTFFKIDKPAGILMSGFMAFLSVCVYVQGWISIKHKNMKLVYNPITKRDELDPNYLIYQETITD